MSRCPPSETLAMYAPESTTSTSALSSMSAAVTSPGPSLAIVSSMGSSRSSLNFKPFMLRMMSTTSSLTPSIVENSCETPSMRILVTAAPVSPESMTRLSELPKVWPRPRGNGSATKVPRRPSSSSTLKRGGAISNIVKKSPARNVLSLPAVELDDELLFDGRVDLVAPRGVQEAAREVVVVGLEPGWHGHHVLDGVLDGLEIPALLPDRDDVAGLEYGRRDVMLAAVELEVPVHDELARLRAAGGEAKAVDDVVHPQLHEPEEVLARDALHPGSPVVGPPELLLGDPVVPAGLLLLHEPEAELGLAMPASSVLAGRVGLLLQRVLPHGREHYPGPPVPPAPRSCVTRHSQLPPAPLGRPAPVVRLARHVLYGEHLYAHGLDGAGGHVPARAVALDLDVDAPQALVHGLVGDALGRHLGREGRALAAPFETQRSRGLPGDDVALLVAHRDDGVVEGALYVDHPGRYVPADPPARPARPARASSLLPLPAHLPLLPPAYRGLRPLALAGVRLGALPAHGEAPAVPDSPVRSDVYKPPDVLVDLAPEVALDLDVLVYVGPDPGDLALSQVAHLRVGIDLGLAADLPRRRTADAVDVGKPYLDPLLPWKVYACYPRHTNPASACGGGSCR